MQPRRELFPGVIELNVQARRRLGCCVYVVFDPAAPAGDWAIVDIGYEDTVDEIIELIRDIDLPLANCVAVIATHADADHVQGLARAKELLPDAPVLAHPSAAPLLEAGDREQTFAKIAAQNIDLPMPPVKVDRLINDGDAIAVGSRSLTVWHTPGHAPAQLSFYLSDDHTAASGPLLFSGDNLYRDGCVGHIDPHHGSDIPDFLTSLRRIGESDAAWLLPSHGPVFKKDDAVIQESIARLERYAKRADFGTCAVEWPLLDEWDAELAAGTVPS